MTDPYSQRTTKISKLDWAKLNSKWATRPKRDEGISQKQRYLWDALNQFVTERGAAITSVRYANPVRLEIPVVRRWPIGCAKLAMI